MFICFNFMGGFREAEMEKKYNIFNYLNAKLIESIYTIVINILSLLH